MLMVEHINCEKGTNEDGVGVVKVSVVIRAIPAPVDYHRPPTRTGLSGMTLSPRGYGIHQMDSSACVGSLEGLIQDLKDVIL